MTPPPTSFLNFTRARSGSTPVVSQSIMKPMVPVGASTVAWALRNPCSAPSITTRSQHSWAARASGSGTRLAWTFCTAARWARMTSMKESWFWG